MSKAVAFESFAVAFKPKAIAFESFAKPDTSERRRYEY
jgi:hypothetical protein